MIMEEKHSPNLIGKSERIVDLGTKVQVHLNAQEIFRLRRISVVGVLDGLESTTVETTLVASYAMRQLYVSRLMRSNCMRPKVFQTSHNVQSPIHFSRILTIHRGSLPKL